MNILKRFFKKPDHSEMSRLIDARMESSRKKQQTADEIIEMLDPKNFNLERRTLSLGYTGPERRHA